MIKQNIVEDIANLYSSIYEQAESQEDQELLEDIVNVVCLSMIYEGYSAKAVYNFFENANIDEIFYRYENFDESVISESTLPEEYIEEQIQVLNEFVGALSRVVKSAFQAARHAPKGQRVAAAFKGGGTAATRVGTQGTRQSSVIRKSIDAAKSKLGAAKTAAKTAATGAASKLKSAAVPALVGGTVGYVAGKSGDSKDSGASGASKPDSSEPKVDSSKWGKDDPIVLGRKGGVQGRLNKKTGEWEKKEWDDPEQQRYQKEKEKIAAKNESYSSYDIVLDYLFENGHVDTLEEAHYVMLEMEPEVIQDIVAEYTSY